MAKKPTTSPASTAAASNHDHARAVPAGGDAAIAGAMDYPAHEAMYHRFTDLVKWGIIGAIILVLFLYIVIHPMLTPAAS
ncbi:MAG: aa3-type cytochrome c oxidase subunit IV [Devosia sp.]|nr:aa3-type cytochrome c oxidase subunit IV [Devosia sp.]